MVYANDVWSARDDGLWHDVSHVADFARFADSDWTRHSLVVQRACCSKAFLNLTFPSWLISNFKIWWLCGIVARFYKLESEYGK